MDLPFPGLDSPPYTPPSVHEEIEVHHKDGEKTDLSYTNRSVKQTNSSVVKLFSSLVPCLQLRRMKLPPKKKEQT